MAGREKDIQKAQESLKKLESEFELMKEHFADKLG